MPKVKELTVSVGMSVDNNGVWVKSSASINLEVQDVDFTNEKEKRSVMDRAYELAEEAVDNEMEKLLDKKIVSE